MVSHYRISGELGRGGMGELDNVAPLQTSVMPFFKMLGTADADKNVVAPGGHVVPRPLLIRETLEWLDQYLGPVRRGT